MSEIFILGQFSDIKDYTTLITSSEPVNIFLLHNIARRFEAII